MSSHARREPIISFQEALRRLREGNERFLRGAVRPAKLGKEILAELAKGQEPYATILSCSDSRVPPELVFDAGLGELFVVRIAGNVFSPEVSGSIQYADACLKTPLFVVLGHEKCGAVEAAVEAKLRGALPPPRVKVLVEDLIPGLAGLDPQLPPGEQLSRAVEANVRWTMRQILEEPEDQACLEGGRTKLMGAVYDIESGHVRFLT